MFLFVTFWWMCGVTQCMHTEHINSDINDDPNYGIENDPDYKLDKAHGFDLEDNIMTTSTTPTMKRTTSKTCPCCDFNNQPDYGFDD